MNPEFTLLDEEPIVPEAPVTLSQLMAAQGQVQAEGGERPGWLRTLEKTADITGAPQRAVEKGLSAFSDYAGDIAIGAGKGLASLAALPAEVVDWGSRLVVPEDQPRLAPIARTRALVEAIGGKRPYGDVIAKEVPDESLYRSEDPVRRSLEKAGDWGAGGAFGKVAKVPAAIGAGLDILGEEALGLSAEDSAMLGVAGSLTGAVAGGVGKATNWLTGKMGPSLRDRAMQSSGHKAKQIKELDGEATTKLGEAIRWVRQNFGPKSKTPVIDNATLSGGPRAIIPKAKTLIAEQQSRLQPIVDAIDTAGGKAIAAAGASQPLPRAAKALENAPEALRKQATKQLEMYEELITKAALGDKPATEILKNVGYLNDTLENAYPQLKGIKGMLAAIKEDLLDIVESAANKVEPGSGSVFKDSRKKMDYLIEYKRGVERTLVKLEEGAGLGNKLGETPPIGAMIGQKAAIIPEAISATGRAADTLLSGNPLPGIAAQIEGGGTTNTPPAAFSLMDQNAPAPQEAAFELLPDDLATPVEQMPVNGAMAPSGGAFQGVAYNPEIPPQSLPRSSDDFFSIAEEALGPLLEDPEIADLMQQARSAPPTIRRTALAGIIEKRPELFPPVDHPYLQGYTVVDKHIVSADKAIQYGQREMYADDLKRRVDAGLVSRSTYAKALSSLNTDGYVMELDMPIDKVSQYDDLIEDAAKEFNLPPNLIRAVIRQESSGNANATGPQTKYGVARGLMQIMQSATDEVAKMGIKVTDPYDPKQNIRAGAAYLAKNIERVKKTWKGEDTSDLYSKALGAYHSGIGNLTKVGYDVSKLGPQGRAYVKKVMKNFSTYSELLDDNYPIEDRANAIDALASQKKPSTSA